MFKFKFLFYSIVWHDFYRGFAFYLPKFIEFQFKSIAFASAFLLSKTFPFYWWTDILIFQQSENLLLGYCFCICFVDGIVNETHTGLKEHDILVDKFVELLSQSLMVASVQIYFMEVFIVSLFLFSFLLVFNSSHCKFIIILFFYSSCSFKIAIYQEILIFGLWAIVAP